MDKKPIKIENSGREEMRVSVPLKLGNIRILVTITTSAQTHDDNDLLYIYRYDINEAVIRALTEDLNETVVFATMDPRLATRLQLRLGVCQEMQHFSDPHGMAVALNLRTAFLINGLPTFVTLNADVAVPMDLSTDGWVLIHDAVSTVLLRNLTEANIIRHMKK